MTDTPPPAGSDPGARTADPSGPSFTSERGARRSRNQRIGATLLFQGTRIGALIPMLVLLGLLVILIIEAIPAIRYNGWGFFTFGHHPLPYAASAAEKPVTECAGCHLANVAATDMTWIQFYPLLRDKKGY